MFGVAGLTVDNLRLTVRIFECNYGVKETRRGTEEMVLASRKLSIVNPA
jgi:hypothetical protein